METCWAGRSSLDVVSGVEPWEGAPGSIYHLLGLFPPGLLTPAKQSPTAACPSREVHFHLFIQRGPSYLPLINSGSWWEPAS